MSLHITSKKVYHNLPAEGKVILSYNTNTEHLGDMSLVVSGGGFAGTMEELRRNIVSMMKTYDAFPKVDIIDGESFTSFIKRFLLSIDEKSKLRLFLDVYIVNLVILELNIEATDVAAIVINSDTDADNVTIDVDLRS